jgi:hypothetical protein
LEVAIRDPALVGGTYLPVAEVRNRGIAIVVQNVEDIAKEFEKTRTHRRQPLRVVLICHRLVITIRCIFNVPCP